MLVVGVGEREVGISQDSGVVSAVLVVVGKVVMMKFLRSLREVEQPMETERSRRVSPSVPVASPMMESLANKRKRP